MYNIKTIILDIPESIRAYTIADTDGSYTICLNSSLDSMGKKKAREHELKHIENRDFALINSVGLIEIRAHTDLF